MEETLRPNGNGDSSQCYGSDSNQVNNFQLVDESVANDADYVYSYSAVGTYLDLYNIPSTAIPAGSTINKITFYARFMATSGYDYCKFAYKSDGTIYYSAEPNVTASYALYSWQQTTNQKTSAPWTIDDINALQIGQVLYLTQSGKDFWYGYCSQIYIVIDYTVAEKRAQVIIF